MSAKKAVEKEPPAPHAAGRTERSPRQRGGPADLAASSIRLQRLIGNRATAALLAGEGRDLETLGSGRGAPLDASTRRDMEARLGASFETVRVREDRLGRSAAQRIGAEAFTHGEEIGFAPGRYSPGTSAGRALLAHELAHVVQQRAAGGSRPGVGDARDRFERQADAAAQAALGSGEDQASVAADHFASTQAAPVPALQLKAATTPRKRPPQKQLRTPIPVAVKKEMTRQIVEIKTSWRGRTFGLKWSDVEVVVSLVWEYAGAGRDAAGGGRGAPSDWVDTLIELMMITAYDRGTVFTRYTSLWDDALQNAAPDQRERISRYLSEVGSQYATYAPPSESEEPSFGQEVAAPVAWKALELFSIGLVDEVLFEESSKAAKKGFVEQIEVVAKLLAWRLFGIFTFGGGPPAYESVVKYYEAHQDEDPWTNLAGAIAVAGEAFATGLLTTLLPIAEAGTLAGDPVLDPKTGQHRDPTIWEKAEAFFSAVIKVASLGEMLKSGARGPNKPGPRGGAPGVEGVRPGVVEGPAVVEKAPPTKTSAQAERPLPIEKAQPMKASAAAERPPPVEKPRTVETKTGEKPRTAEGRPTETATVEGRPTETATKETPPTEKSPETERAPEPEKSSKPRPKRPSQPKQRARTQSERPPGRAAKKTARGKSGWASRTSAPEAVEQRATGTTGGESETLPPKQPVLRLVPSPEGIGSDAPRMAADTSASPPAGPSSSPPAGSSPPTTPATTGAPSPKRATPGRAASKPTGRRIRMPNAPVPEKVATPTEELVAEPGKSKSPEGKGGETGLEKEARELGEDRPKRSPKSRRYFDWEGGTRRTIRGFLNDLEAHLKKVAPEESLRTTKGTARQELLSMTREEFISRTPALSEIWDHWRSELAGEMERNRRQHAEARDPATREQLDRALEPLEAELAAMDQFGKGEIGSLRPDHVEVNPEARTGTVWDITQRPFDPPHNFKTRLYMEVMRVLTGYEVTGWDWSNVFSNRFFPR